MPSASWRTWFSTVRDLHFGTYLIARSSPPFRWFLALRSGRDRISHRRPGLTDASKTPVEVLICCRPGSVVASPRRGEGICIGHEYNEALLPAILLIERGVNNHESNGPVSSQRT